MEIWQPVYWPQGKDLSSLQMACSVELAPRLVAAAAPAFCVCTNPIVSQGYSQTAVEGTAQDLHLSLLF